MRKLLARVLSEGVPALARQTLKFVPEPLPRAVASPILNRLLREPLAAGDFDFLEGYTVAVTLSDVNFSLLLSLENEQLNVLDSGKPDVTLSAKSTDLVLIAARKVDPDTLFFQRRLVIEGDTELGLAVKNLLDAQELTMLPRFFCVLLERLADGLVWARGQHSPVPQG